MEDIRYGNMQTELFELETTEIEVDKYERRARLEESFNRLQGNPLPVPESVDIRSMQGSVYLGRIGLDSPEQTAADFNATSTRCLSEAILKRLRRGFLRTKNYHQVFMLKTQILLEVIADLLLHYDQSLERITSKLTTISEVAFGQLEDLNSIEISWRATSQHTQDMDASKDSCYLNRFLEARNAISVTFAKAVEFKDTLSSLKLQVEQQLKQLSLNSSCLLLLEHIRSFFEQYQNACTRVYRAVQHKTDLCSLHLEDKNLFFMESRLAFCMKELRIHIDRCLVTSVFEFQAAIRAVLSSSADSFAAGYSKLAGCLAALAAEVPAIGPLLAQAHEAFSQPDLRCSPLESLQPRVKGYIKQKLEMKPTVSLEETDLADFFQFAEIRHPTLSAYVILAQQVCKRAEERSKKSFLLLVDVVAIDCRCSATSCCGSPSSNPWRAASGTPAASSKSTSSRSTCCVSRSARHVSSSIR